MRLSDIEVIAIKNLPTDQTACRHFYTMVANVDIFRARKIFPSVQMVLGHLIVHLSAKNPVLVNLFNIL